jgi:hypothetical protein
MALDRDDKIVLGLVVATAVLMNVPYGYYALYPFKLFATWIHESFHGLAALATGGSVETVEIFSDTSGVTKSLLSPGTAARSLVASMGYLGTSIAGAILLSLRRRPTAQRWALAIIALGMVLSLVFWVRNAFGAVTVALLAVAVGLLAVRAAEAWASIATNVLASQACVNALLDIRVLYGVQGHSDAATMADVVGLWPWFWATLWLVISVLLLWVAWRRPARQRGAAPHLPTGAKPT